MIPGTFSRDSYLKICINLFLALVKHVDIYLIYISLLASFLLRD